MKDIYKHSKKEDSYINNDADIKIVSKIINLTKDCRKICDIGFGNTILAEMLTEINPEIYYYGIDIDNACVKKSKEKALGGNVHFIHGSLSNADITQIDCYIMSRVIHHMSPQEFNKVLHDILLQIKKGGRLIIVDSIRDYTNRHDRNLYLPFYIFTQTVQYLSIYKISSKCFGTAALNKYWIMKLDITQNGANYMLEFIE